MKAKVTKFYNLVLRLAIILATYGFIYSQVFHHRSLDELARELSGVIRVGQGAGLILAAFLLMPVNWGIEALKWRKMIGHIERIGIFPAFKAVFSGISVSMFTPNRTGEFLGRVFILGSANRVEGILVTVAGSISQMLITVVMGTGGLAFAMMTGLKGGGYDHRLLYAILLAVTPLLLSLLLLVYFNLSGFTRMLMRVLPDRWAKFRNHLNVLETYNRKELTEVLLFSLSRYLVFSVQFYLLLQLFGIRIPFPDALMLIALVYLVMLVVPSMAVLEVGIRGSVSIVIFQAYLGTSGQALGLFSASVMLWIINLVIPAVIGTFFVHQLRFFRR